MHLCCWVLALLSALLPKVEAWRGLRRGLAAGVLGLGLGGAGPSEAAISNVGNVGAAVRAVLRNPVSLTCSLDNQNSESGESCQQLDDVVRVRAGKLLTIRQDWGGSASTGAAVWNGANVATWFLEHELGPAGAVRGKSVIELGAGVGFTSLVADALGAAEVVITDGNEDVLKLADANIATNVDATSPSASASGGRTIRTARLRWNDAGDEQPLLLSAAGTPWDLVFASDVTYRKAGWADLTACLAHLTGPGTQTVLSMEPRNVGEVQGVLRLLEAQGLGWREVPVPGADPAKTLCSPFCARLFVITRPAAPAAPAAPAPAPAVPASA